MRARKKRNLAEADPTGRLDVMLYRLAGRGLEELEHRHNLAGLCENFLPVIERFIIRNIPAANFITPNLQALLNVAQLNAAREGKDQCS